MPPARLATLLAALALSAGAASSLRLSATRHYVASQRPEDLYYLPPAEWLPTLAVGYREAAADLVWIRSLIYYGESFGSGIPIRYVVNYGRAATTLDPSFDAVYGWVSTAAAYQVSAPSIEDLERAAAFLDEGVRRFPNHGELSWHAGSFWAYELALRYPAGSAQRRRADERGREHLLEAARLGAGPPWLPLANASQLANLGRHERAVEHLEEMYALTTDPDIRDAIRAQINAVRSSVVIESIDRLTRETEEARLADFPYLPTSFYALVGRRIVAHVDGEAPRSRDPGADSP